MAPLPNVSGALIRLHVVLNIHSKRMHAISPESDHIDIVRGFSFSLPAGVPLAVSGRVMPSTKSLTPDTRSPPLLRLPHSAPRTAFFFQHDAVTCSRYCLSCAPCCMVHPALSSVPSHFHFHVYRGPLFRLHAPRLPPLVSLAPVTKFHLDNACIQFQLRVYSDSN